MLYAILFGTGAYLFWIIIHDMRSYHRLFLLMNHRTNLLEDRLAELEGKHAGKDQNSN